MRSVKYLLLPKSNALSESALNSVSSFHIFTFIVDVEKASKPTTLYDAAHSPNNQAHSSLT